jgi:putative flippase GtrA
MLWHSLFSYFSRYSISGILATLIHFGSLTILVSLWAIDPVEASAAGFFLAAIYNYVFQYYWVFKVKAPHWQFLSRYVSFHIITLWINTELFWAISAKLSPPFLLVQLYVSACIITLNILVNGHFILNLIKASADYVVSNKKPLISRKFIATFMRYFISGGLAALIHFGTLILLIEKFTINPVIATTAGFCLAVVFNYTAQYYWTFKVSGSHQQFMLRYFGVTLITLMVNTGLFWLLNIPLQLPYLAAQIFATGIVFLLNFFINHHYTFKSQSNSQDATDLT